MEKTLKVLANIKAQFGRAFFEVVFAVWCEEGKPIINKVWYDLMEEKLYWQMNGATYSTFIED